MKYKYEVHGCSAENSWSTGGHLEAATAGEFIDLPMKALSTAFADLTQGKAVFGYPGVGCKGPYSITKLLIELEPAGKVPPPPPPTTVEKGGCP